MGGLSGLTLAPCEEQKNPIAIRDVLMGRLRAGRTTLLPLPALRREQQGKDFPH